MSNDNQERYPGQFDEWEDGETVFVYPQVKTVDHVIAGIDANYVITKIINHENWEK